MELLSPAGNMEKLKIAVEYGADAVYFGGEAFGLRANAGNFTMAEMTEAMDYLHSKGKKGYLTVNAYARDEEIPALKEYLKKVSALVDAFIISDPGVFYVAKEVAPDMEIHISTQANTTNTAAVNFWAAQGAKRVIVARELSKEQLANLVANSPIQVEAFIHGAICISYSGRCIMSAYMTGRDANQRECTQPCRWNYTVKEVTRPLQQFDIEEDERGTYLYNAKDLCLIDHIGEMCGMGVSSMKIEGRMKSVMYVAVATAVYRQAIDAAMKGEFNVNPEWRELLDSVSNRHYTEGFYSSVPDKDAMNYDTSAYVRKADFIGIIKDAAHSGDRITFNLECRAKAEIGETLEIFTSGIGRHNVKVASVKLNNNEEPFTKPNNIYTIEVMKESSFDTVIHDGALLRRILI